MKNSVIQIDMRIVINSGKQAVKARLVYKQHAQIFLFRHLHKIQFNKNILLILILSLVVTTNSSARL